MLFITAGMGGGTGTGAAPVIARIAKEMGILTVGVVTKPFEWEGGRRMKNADDGLAELETNVDSLIVVLNEKLLEVLGDDITQDEAFAHANDVLKNAVGGIAEIINIRPCERRLRRRAHRDGRARQGHDGHRHRQRPRPCPHCGRAGRGLPAARRHRPLGARGVLVLVTAAKGSLKLSESRLAMSTINAYASPDAHVIYGAAYDDTLGDEIRVTVVATGLSRANARRQPISVVQGGLRTGTDNMSYPMSGTGMLSGCGHRAWWRGWPGRLCGAQRVAHQPHAGCGAGGCPVLGRHG